MPFIFCSGTLIHARAFLTAGHCTAALADAIGAGGITIDQVKVSFDPDDALNASTWNNVSSIVTHPEFNNFAFLPNPRDVGVLVLAGPAAPTPAALPGLGTLDEARAARKLRRGRRHGTRFTVVGYGTTLDLSPPVVGAPDGKRRAAESGFKNVQDALLNLSQSQKAGFGGTGFGDSGGPAFWVDPDDPGETEILVGLTSRGDPKLVATGVYYRVDIAETLDFLADVIDDLPGL